MMGKQQRVKLVELLDRRGAFIFRSAVPTVSRVLGISRYTLYNYLKQIRAAMGAGAAKTAPRPSRRGDA